MTQYDAGYAYSWKEYACSIEDEKKNLDNREWRKGYDVAISEMSSAWGDGRGYGEVNPDGEQSDNPYPGTSLMWVAWNRGFQYSIYIRQKEQREAERNDGDGDYF